MTKNWIKKILCDILHWHNGKPDFSKSSFGQIKGICKRCGKKVLLDSQGNWF
jgi:hypothetical protein